MAKVRSKTFLRTKRAYDRARRGYAAEMKLQAARLQKKYQLRRWRAQMASVRRKEKRQLERQTRVFLRKNPDLKPKA